MSGRYDPLDNPYNRLQSSPVMAYYGMGFFWEFLLGRHWSVGIDLNYLSNMNSLKECDRIIYGEEAASSAKYSSISVGIGLVHEFYWRNLAGYLTLGAYPYLKTDLGKDIQWNYQKAGLRYYFPKANDMFVGFVIKASSFVADHFELSFGLRLQHNSVQNASINI